jgi:HEAT repeat protein
VPFLDDTEEHVRREAARAIANIDPSRDEPLGLLVGLVAKGRCFDWATAALRRYGGRAATRLVSIEVAETGPRFCILGALAKLSPSPSFPAERVLEKTLEWIESGDRGVHQNAFPLIEQIGPRAASATPRLLQYLTSDVESLYRGAHFALRGIGKPAVAGLVQLLRSGNVDARRRALRVLADIGAEASAAVPTLEKARDDEDLLTRLDALQALWKIEGQVDDPVPTLRLGLASDDAEIHRRVRHFTRDLGPAASRLAPDLFAAMERNPSWGNSLALVGVPKDLDVARLLSMLQNKGGFLLSDRAVLKVIAQLGERAEPAVPVLVERAKSANEYERRTALQILEKLGPFAKSALPGLIELLSDDASRAHVATTIRAIDPSNLEMISPLRAHLARSHRSDERPDSIAEDAEEIRHRRRVDAARTLWAITGKSRPLIPVLVEEIRAYEYASSDPEVIALLGEIGPPAAFALPVLRRALRELYVGTGRSWRDVSGGGDAGNFDGRNAAVRSITKITGDQRLLLDFLFKHFDKGRLSGASIDLTDRIREKCAEQLAAIGKSALPQVARRLRHDHPTVRRYAAYALEKLGADAKSALPALREALEDPRPVVRQAAARAVAEIGKSQP